MTFDLRSTGDSPAALLFAILESMRAHSYIIWFVGSGVWWLVAALAIHHGERQRALGSLAIAVVFFCSGMFFQRNAPRL